MFKKGCKHTEETKKKISLANKGKHLSPNTEFKKGHKFIKGGEKWWFKKSQMLGSKSLSWKGGVIKRNNYVSIYAPNHPCNSYGYVREHRLVMQKHLGRYLSPSEVVHHLNYIKDDNRIENLKLFANQSEHCKFPNP